MDGKQEKKAQLSKLLPFWKELSEADRERLIEQSTTRQYKKGEIFHNCTGACLGLIAVMRGTLSVCMVSDEGREITLFSLYSGELCVFGTACAMRPVTCHSHIATEADTEILLIPHLLWEEIMKCNVVAECYAYKVSWRLLSQVLFTMQQMLFWEFDTRLAYYLVSESRRVGSLRIRTTHEKVARSIGSAREVVSRMLKKFVEMGWVELHRGVIVIRDKAALEDMIPHLCD